MSERERLEDIIDERLRRQREERESFLSAQNFPITGSVITAEKLSPQLGSSPEVLAKGKFDMRLLSAIGKRQLMALVFLYQRGKKVPFYRDFVDNYLSFTVSVNARGRKDLIKMQSVTSGAPPEPPPEQPGWWGRNVTQRNWREESE